MNTAIQFTTLGGTGKTKIVEQRLKKIAAFGTAKGGVGKTSMCVNVAAELVTRGNKVLVIDGDPQANLTSCLGFSIYEEVDADVCSSVLFRKDCPSIETVVFGGGEDPESWVAGMQDLYVIPAHDSLVFQDRALLNDLFDEKQQASAWRSKKEMYMQFLNELKNLHLRAVTAKEKNEIAETMKKVKASYDEEAKTYASQEHIREAGVLKRNFEKYYDFLSQFDYIFFDLNTYMSEINLNILAVVDSLVTVTDPSMDGLTGIQTFSNLYYGISNSGDFEGNEPNQAIILNKMETRPLAYRDVRKILSGDFEDFEKDELTEEGNLISREELTFSEISQNYIDCPISKTVMFAESSFKGCPIVQLDRKDKNKILGQIRDLTDQLIEKEIL